MSSKGPSFFVLLFLIMGLYFAPVRGSPTSVSDHVTTSCRRLPPVTAWSTPLIIKDKTRAHRDMLCPYSKIKLTKLSLNNLLDKFPSPLIFMIYIFVILHLHIQSYVYLYFWIIISLLCKIHTNSEQPCMIRERI